MLQNILIENKVARPNILMSLKRRGAKQWIHTLIITKNNPLRIYLLIYLLQILIILRRHNMCRCNFVKCKQESSCRFTHDGQDRTSDMESKRREISNKFVNESEDFLITLWSGNCFLFFV